MSNDSAKQASIRAATGTEYDYNGDWSALFDLAGIGAGTWNERLLMWLNTQISPSQASLPDAMQAYAVAQGFDNWSSMTALSLGPAGNGILLEDGASFLLVEDNSYMILEQA